MVDLEEFKSWFCVTSQKNTQATSTTGYSSGELSPGLDQKFHPGPETPSPVEVPPQPVHSHEQFLFWSINIFQGKTVSAKKFQPAWSGSNINRSPSKMLSTPTARRFAGLAKKEDWRGKSGELCCAGAKMNISLGLNLIVFSHVV